MKNDSESADPAGTTAEGANLNGKVSGSLPTHPALISLDGSTLSLGHASEILARTHRIRRMVWNYGTGLKSRLKMFRYPHPLGSDHMIQCNCFFCLFTSHTKLESIYSYPSGFLLLLMVSRAINQPTFENESLLIDEGDTGIASVVNRQGS